MRRKFCRSTFVLLATGALATSAALAEEQEQPTQPEQVQPQQGNQLPPGQVPAVLKSSKADFVYRSTYRPLSCDQLRNRVALILQAVGARQDVRVRANECNTFIDPSTQRPGGSSVDSRMDTRTSSGRSPWDTSPQAPGSGMLDRMRPSATDQRSQSTPVYIELMIPAEATTKIINEVEQDKARRELISRVTGNPGAAMDDPIFFAAERRQITLSYDTIKLESIDCELLEQMSRTVFRQLNLKVTHSPTNCDRNERSHLRPQVTVEALLPVGFAMPGEAKREKASGGIQVVP
jgi:hypothetical protein